MTQPMCSDCGGWDIEWMHRCHKHPSVQYCRGCQCPVCAEEDLDDDDGTQYDTEHSELR